MTKRDAILGELCARIVALHFSHPTRVAIDGPDAAGKTTLANELALVIAAMGRTVIRASIDGFIDRAPFATASTVTPQKLSTAIRSITTSCSPRCFPHWVPAATVGIALRCLISGTTPL
jgi:hypothetical protein